MSKRCLYDPTEDGHCTNCGGLPDGLNCPVTGRLMVPEGGTAHASRNLNDAARAFGAAAMATLGLAAALEFLGDVIEGTIDDDRA